MNTPLLLGVDGGGTSTIAWLADPQGNVMGRGQSGPSNAKAVGWEHARRSIELAISRAFSEGEMPRAPVAVACLGLAGFDRAEDKMVLQGWAEAGKWASRLVLVNDGELLLAAGTPEGWGIGVIAGTGSIAVGRAADGRTARAGGWGPLFGDEGSAYWVALETLRWLSQEADGRLSDCEDDLLARRVCEYFGVAQVPELVSAVYSEGVDRVRLAGLAPRIVEAAEERSPGAMFVLERAADELSRCVVAVAAQLGLAQRSGDELPLVMAGGFLLSAQPMAEALLRQLRDRGIIPSSVTPVPDPVFGALTLARRAFESEEKGS